MWLDLQDLEVVHAPFVGLVDALRQAAARHQLHDETRRGRIHEARAVHLHLPIDRQNEQACFDETQAGRPLCVCGRGARAGEGHQFACNVELQQRTQHSITDSYHTQPSCIYKMSTSILFFIFLSAFLAFVHD